MKCDRCGRELSKEQVFDDIPLYCMNLYKGSSMYIRKFALCNNCFDYYKNVDKLDVNYKKKYKNLVRFIKSYSNFLFDESVMMDVGEYGDGERAAIDYIITHGIEEERNLTKFELNEINVKELGFEDKTNPGYLSGLLLVIKRNLTTGESSVVYATKDVYLATAVQLMLIVGCYEISVIAPHVDENVESVKNNLIKTGRDRLCNNEEEVYIISFPERKDRLR